MALNPSNTSASVTLSKVLTFEVERGLDGWSGSEYLSVLMGQVSRNKSMITFQHQDIEIS